MSRRGKILDSIPCHGCEKGDNPEKRKIVLVNITRPPYAKGLYERTDIEYHCGLGKKYDNCSLAVLYRMVNNKDRKEITFRRDEQRA